VWFEVINLIVPTYTDDLEMIKRMCGWLVENLGPDRPLHFSRFSPQHKLDHLPPTPVDLLVQARATARAAGLRYVYIGNVREVDDAGTTYCPNCKRAVIERDIFAVTSYRLEAGQCRFCRTPIAGVWVT
jgi:pyruvate formate lyase activating enzyme